VTFLCLSRDLTNSVPFISAISLVNITGNVTAASAFEDVVYMGYYYVTQFRWNFGGDGIIRYVISQNYVRSIQVNGRVVMLFTLPICDKFLQLSLLKAQETFLAFHVGKRVETSDRIKVELTKHRESCARDQYFNVIF
jgi:hypothetical protein